MYGITGLAFLIYITKFPERWISGKQRTNTKHATKTYVRLSTYHVVHTVQ